PTRRFYRRSPVSRGRLRRSTLRRCRCRSGRRVLCRNMGISTNLRGCRQGARIPRNRCATAARLVPVSPVRACSRPFLPLHVDDLAELLLGLLALHLLLVELHALAE